MGVAYIMSQSRRKFIESNREALENYGREADGKTEPIHGFGVYSPKERFQALLTEDDDFHLPACLLDIFWVHKDSKDRGFVLQSLEHLYEIDDEGRVEDPTIAYVYSYCLLQSDKDDESFEILRRLSDQCFPPALATMGDGAIANQEIVNALDWYEHAIDHGYLTVIGRRNRLVLRNSSFLKSLPIRVTLTLETFGKYLHFIKSGMKGENALYLDFYSMRHHLNKHWKIPKAERIERLIKESAYLSKLEKLKHEQTPEGEAKIMGKNKAAHYLANYNKT